MLGQAGPKSKRVGNELLFQVFNFIKRMFIIYLNRYLQWGWCYWQISFRIPKMLFSCCWSWGWNPWTRSQTPRNSSTLDKLPISCGWLWGIWIYQSFSTGPAPHLFGIYLVKISKISFSRILFFLFSHAPHKKFASANHDTHWALVLFAFKQLYDKGHLHGV